MTAYRQEALACAAALAHGPLRPRNLKLSVPEAPKILQGNVYGWFINVERGVYTLTDAGHAALKRWPDYATPVHQPPPIDAPGTAAAEGRPRLRQKKWPPEGGHFSRGHPSRTCRTIGRSSTS